MADERAAVASNKNPFQRDCDPQKLTLADGAAVDACDM